MFPCVSKKKIRIETVSEGGKLPFTNFEALE